MPALVSVALGARGVTDVKALSVECYRDGHPSGSSSRENIALNADEKPKVRAVSVQAG